MFSRINENIGRFSLTMGYEAHPSDFQKNFGDLFSHVTVVKWTLEIENVFVFVKCNYVTVALCIAPIFNAVPATPKNSGLQFSTNSFRIAAMVCAYMLYAYMSYL